MVENRKKHRQNSHSIIHCPTSEGVSERLSAAEGASEASETSERCERTDERVAQYISLYSRLLSTIVHCQHEPNTLLKELGYISNLGKKMSSNLKSKKICHVDPYLWPNQKCF